MSFLAFFLPYPYFPVVLLRFCLLFSFDPPVSLCSFFLPFCSLLPLSFLFFLVRPPIPISFPSFLIVVCLPVRISARMSQLSTAAAACGGFAAVGSTRRRYRSTAAAAGRTAVQCSAANASCHVMIMVAFRIMLIAFKISCLRSYEVFDLFC